MYSCLDRATTMRHACSKAPRSTSSNRGNAGNIGNPAASPDVYPSVRNALLFKSNFAPFAACQPELVYCISQVSQMNPLPGCTILPWRSPPQACCHCVNVIAPVSCGHVSMGILLGIG